MDRPLSEDGPALDRTERDAMIAQMSTAIPQPCPAPQARRSRPRSLALAMLASLGLLVLGLSLPILSVRSLWLFTDRFSIFDAVLRLLAEGELVVAAAVATFSIGFPLCKLVAAFALWRRLDAPPARRERAVRRLEWVGRWAMLDVFVAALVVFSVKASGIADARTEPGLYLFLASVLLSMAAIHRLRALAAVPEPPAA